ncbi:MAG: gluconate permease [Planctomycetes bacterium]|nr:gluconate permease [Planctomycetota bacterium]
MHMDLLAVLAAETPAQVSPAWPLIILAVGIAVVVGMIVVLRVNAFLALITAAIVVSLLAPGAFAEKITRVAAAFGETAGKIGIVIALAAVIGKCLIDSGAADRIVRAFVNLLGEKRSVVSLMSSGFVLSIPVFFDTVFYLLLPLARSMHRRTGRSYLLLILAMGVGASITHSLVPPTPGPLLIAGTLGIDLGVMIVMGLACAIPTAVLIYFFVGWLSRRIDIPMRPLEGMGSEPPSLADERLPGLLASLAPILLPVLLIATHTVVTTLCKGIDVPPATSPADLGAGADVTRTIPFLKRCENVTAVFGNANLAMLLAAAVALYVLWRQRRPSRQELAGLVENSLMGAGVIILITSAGGAFGAMLKQAQIGEAIQTLMAGDGGAPLGGVQLLVMAFGVATLLKFAQGSSTVSMITTSGMIAALLGPEAQLGYHPVYLACAIGFGAQCLNWMNDSGFWIFAKMGGLTEVETLKTWTVTVSTMAVIGLLVTITLAKLLPLVQ